MSDDTQQDSTVETIAAKAIDTGAPRTATFADLRRKPRRKLTFQITTADETGEEIVLNMVYLALNPVEYDRLVSEHKPKPADERRGAIFNVDTFAPALIAACSHEPKLSYEDAHELYHSEEWASGEITTLFINAQRVCNSGLDVSFNDRG